MRSKFSKLKVSPIASATLLSIAFSSPTCAQLIDQEITITAEPVQRVSGFDGISSASLPMSVTTINQHTLQDIGAQRISDALRLDASVSDSYNLPAYWDKLSVRGFALDNRYNYRREGLPISAETILAMENKERIELLKGTSGIQAGTSAPGGLVNYVVKRAPNDADTAIRDVTLAHGTVHNRLAAADLGGRLGEYAEFGYRFNVAHEDLDPYIRETKGHRDLVALAMDWRIHDHTRLEWEFEQSHHEQIGVNFYSLLGSGANALPAPVDGKRNITLQPNALPGIFDGLTSTLKLKQQLDNGWSLNTQYGTQRLRADDRLIYASGCESAPTDRFCGNGDFQIREYRSDNEHRNSEAIQSNLGGVVHLSGFEHRLNFSILRQRQIYRMAPTYSDNLVGTTNSLLGGLTPPSAANNKTDLNTHSDEYRTELAANDHIQLSETLSGWLGLRHTQLHRSSALTDGNSAIQDARSINTPWVALSRQLTPQYTVYASYGYGIETQVAPNLSNYTNAAQPLPALRSTQREAGLKHQHGKTLWQAAWFDITRPAMADAGINCGYQSAANTCTRQVDGQNHHQGFELSGHSSFQRWELSGSAMWLQAEREHATVQTELNGQRIINVPQSILRGTAQYRFANVPGLRAAVRVSHEGERQVTNNDAGNIVLPAWTTFDASTHYDTRVNNVPSRWTLAIQNVTNHHYWRESPRQYGQYFLYPGAPRTVRASVLFHL